MKKILFTLISLCGYSGLVMAQDMDSSSTNSAEYDAPAIKKPAMVAINGGRFLMGKTTGHPVKGATVRKEHPRDSAYFILNSFWISQYEVSVGEYELFCKETQRKMPDPPGCSGWNRNDPMVNINYEDALDYCNWLSETFNERYRLPTEAEWEYAARGGKKTKNYSLSGSDDIDKVGWTKDNSGGQVQTRGSKHPNELGIYDMSGNVWEWCGDWEGPYAANNTKNPEGPDSGEAKIIRGGSANALSFEGYLWQRQQMHPATSDPYIGFRIVREKSR